MFPGISKQFKIDDDNAMIFTAYTLSFLASAFFLSSYLVRLISPVRPFSKMTKHISFFSTSDYHRKITTNSHERQRYVLQKVKR